ncbi:MAG: BlaI/MecI/CopY family transcriptional regulator [Phycisphaerae bacterium]|nr:BlaI/MecI/CopY family transcriptional regulator [Phycisphaerae bacterium]
MKKHELDLFETEWTILQVVWKKEPCSAPEVQEALADQKKWAYTTVKTMMDRMVKKDLLVVEKVRNLNRYSTAITQQQAQKSEIARTIKRAFQGAITPMMQFMVENEDIPSTEFDKLEELIRQRKKKFK